MWMQVSKSLFVAVILIGIIPLMLGLIFELVIVMPIRVPLEMTPVFFPWQVCYHCVLQFLIGRGYCYDAATCQT